MLVDVISKNGNLLLSIPVRGNGTIDERERAILADIKEWMDQNSSSIYGTRPWKTFGEGPLAEVANPMTAQGFNEKNNYSARDVRYVQRHDTLFAAVSPAVQQPEQYYSISGVRLPAYPQKGLFIVRQGSRSKKVSR